MSKASSETADRKRHAQIEGISNSQLKGSWQTMPKPTSKNIVWDKAGRPVLGKHFFEERINLATYLKKSTHIRICNNFARNRDQTRRQACKSQELCEFPSIKKGPQILDWEAPELHAHAESRESLSLASAYSRDEDPISCQLGTTSSAITSS